ncbi:35880_t:CDS:1, partial [Gigaspora margarita]
NKTPLVWICSKNHTWSAPLRRVKSSGSWCPYCTGTVKLTLENIKKIALSKHGECLSTEYKNNQLLLMWHCKENHLWRASVGNVKSGKWCPYCTVNARFQEHMNRHLAIVLIS